MLCLAVQMTQSVYRKFLQIMLKIKKTKTGSLCLCSGTLIYLVIGGRQASYDIFLHDICLFFIRFESGFRVCSVLPLLGVKEAKTTSESHITRSKHNSLQQNLNERNEADCAKEMRQFRYVISYIQETMFFFEGGVSSMRREDGSKAKHIGNDILHTYKKGPTGRKLTICLFCCWQQKQQGFSLSFFLLVRQQCLQQHFKCQ